MNCCALIDEWLLFNVVTANQACDLVARARNWSKMGGWGGGGGGGVREAGWKHE